MFRSPCANCRNSHFLFLFIREGVIIVAGIVVGDAENTIISIRLNTIFIAIIDIIFFVDVYLIDIDIIRNAIRFDT